MPHFTRRVGLSLLYILAAAHTAPADVNLKIDLGWDNVYRAGHWTPIFITAWDPTESRGRNVHLEISSPHDAGRRRRIRHHLHPTLHHPLLPTELSA